LTVVDEAMTRILAMVDDGTAESRPYAGNDEGITFEEPFLMSPPVARLIEEMGPHPEAILASEQDVLGYYTPMSSPGTITLDWKVIGSLFWHTILALQRAGLYLERRDVEVMARLTCEKTYIHESFHHFTDVSRRLFGTQFNALVEEALAVACSFRDLAEMHAESRSRASRLSGLLFRELTSRLYRYTSAGYRDWVHYQTSQDFENGLIGYLAPPSAPFLMQSRVDVAALLEAMRKSLGAKGAVEHLTP
jgi:hypothetical protein